MNSHTENSLLALPRFAQLTDIHKSHDAKSSTPLAIDRLFNFARIAVTAYDLNLSRKCFALASDLLHHGDSHIRAFTEKSFVAAFRPFFQKDATEFKRLQFFLPADFYQLFKTRIASKDSLSEDRNSQKRSEIICRLANAEDSKYAIAITDEMCASAKARGCGISRRRPADIIEKMKDGKAVIALTNDGQWVGFSYLEVYDDGKYVSNSGLIVAPQFRQNGVAKEIKQRVFNLSRTLYPHSKIFSITTGGAVMKMNSELGFEPVTYADITKEERFWKGCESCVNYQTLLSKNCKNCFCTAMLYTPELGE